MTVQTAVAPGVLQLGLLRWWVPLLLTPIILTGWLWMSSRRGAARGAYLAFLAVIVAACAALCGYYLRRNVVATAEWDVKAFWVFGRVAASGANYYLPADFHAVAAGDTYSPDFVREVLDVGFVYPPPTMLLVGPIGFFDLHTGALLWMLIQLAAMVASIVLLWRTFFRRDGIAGLLFVAAMVLTLRSSTGTISWGQTNFVVLVALILMWRHRDDARAGIYLALGMATKPICALFALYPLLRRNWRALLAAAGTLAVLSIAVIAAFGLAPFTTFFTNPPYPRVPSLMYTEIYNQALLANILRLTRYDFANGSPLFHPLFIVLAVVILSTTSWLIVRLGARASELGFALTIPAALLVYPQAAESYTVQLLLPILFLWSRRELIPLSATALVSVITAVYAFVRYNGGTATIGGTALLWLTLVVLALRVAAPGREAAGIAPAAA